MVTGASAGEMFDKMNSAEHLKFAVEAYGKKIYAPALMHVQAIPSSATEYKESRLLYTKINLDMNAPHKLKNEQYANKKYLELTKTFLNDLPPACSRTNATISKSGTIIIKTLCDGNGSTPGMDGEIRIKNGKVTTLR